MRFFYLLPFLALAACSSAPERATEAPQTEQQAADNTDKCLDNPELARTWGDCNVKHVLFDESGSLSSCRKLAPKAKSGALTFELQVKKDGSVKYARAKPSSKYPKLEGCIVRVMKRLKFAAPPEGKEPMITVPYQLAP
jgi:outer membrane biosynthesis protein TonB